MQNSTQQPVEDNGANQEVERVLLELRAILSEASLQDYIGEDVSQLEHALQCAKFAKDSGADDEVILGSLFHDIGHFCPVTESMREKLNVGGQLEDQKMGNCGTQLHEKWGALYLQELGFSERVALIVERHVQAKRYLCWKNPEYLKKLSSASQTTLSYQGGPMTEQEAQSFEQSALFEVLLKMRTWDDKAKIVGAVVPPLNAYEPMIRQHLEKQHQQRTVRSLRA
ncbi:HD domain-containing protein [Balamuthia mandrillaris]